MAEVLDADAFTREHADHVDDAVKADEVGGESPNS